MENTERNEQVASLLSKIKEGSDLNLVEATINNNVMEFTVGSISYRVSKPTFSQLQELTRKKLEKYNQLLSDPIFLFEKDLKAKLKAKNVDVDAMQKEIDLLESKKKSIQLKLGELLVKKENESDLKNLRDEIAQITSEQNTLVNQKNSFLEITLESQLNNYIYSYLTYLVTEKKVETEWKRVWNDYHEFESSNQVELIKNAAFYTTLVAIVE